MRDDNYTAWIKRTQKFEDECLRLRNLGYDTFDAAEILSEEFEVPVRESDVYNVLAKHGHTASDSGLKSTRAA